MLVYDSCFPLDLCQNIIKFKVVYFNVSWIIENSQVNSKHFTPSDGKIRIILKIL